MLTRLRVHGYRTLFQTEVTFSPFTIMVGKNGVGKTSLLDVVEIIGKFSRGGAQRAFGPPPWSLAWQRTKGIGQITTTDFEVHVTTQQAKNYVYTLRLNERKNEVSVAEERLIRTSDNRVIAAYEYRSLPASGTILQPDDPRQTDSEISSVSSLLRSFENYELNPSAIERGNDPKVTFVGRDGSGVAGFLAHLQDESPQRFQALETRLKTFRPDTAALEVWSSGDLFWGLRDKQQKYAFPAVHLSWGDRQLVGLLCVLFSAKPGCTIAVEEIDRGFHPSRYSQIIELLTEAAYDGLMYGEKFQVIVTTHSPSFVNKLSDKISDIRIVTRAPNGGTVVRPLHEVMTAKLGTDFTDQPLGEIFELGVLEDAIHEAIK